MESDVNFVESGLAGFPWSTPGTLSPGAYRTVRRYQGILELFGQFADGQGVTKLVNVSMTLIDKFRARRKEKVAPKTMHNEGRLLKSFLGWCEERKLIRENPLGKRKFSPPKPKRRKAPSLVQVNDILDAATALRHPQFALLAFCGARSGEGRNLLVEDVDFVGEWMQIRSRPGHETKNGEDRKVPLHPRLRGILEPLPRNKSGWFFTALPSKRYPHGDHHMNVKRLNEDFVKLLKKLELPAGRDDGFTIHSLRRFFRTTCVNAGVPERVADLWLGHNDGKSMGSIYYDLSDEDSQRFMSLVPFGE